MTSTVFLARLLGLFTVVLALAILINRRGIIAAADKLTHSGDSMLIVEFIGLGVGLAIVLGHNVWSGVLAVVVTLLGWFILLRAVILMLLPPEKLADLLTFVAWPQRAETYALIALVLGALLTIAGFAS